MNQILRYGVSSLSFFIAAMSLAACSGDDPPPPAQQDAAASDAFSDAAADTADACLAVDQICQGASGDCPCAVCCTGRCIANTTSGGGVSARCLP